MRSFIPIFKKSLKYAMLFYLIVCTVFLIGTVIQEWVSPGKVFGTVLMLLTFFLAIPLGILEEIEKVIGFHITQPIKYADMDAAASYLFIYISNLIFAAVLALLFSLLYWIIVNAKSGIQSA